MNDVEADSRRALGGGGDDGATDEYRTTRTNWTRVASKQVTG